MRPPQNPVVQVGNTIAGQIPDHNCKYQYLKSCKNCKYCGARKTDCRAKTSSQPEVSKTPGSRAPQTQKVLHKELDKSTAHHSKKSGNKGGQRRGFVQARCTPNRESERCKSLTPAVLHFSICAGTAKAMAARPLPNTKLNGLPSGEVLSQSLGWATPLKNMKVTWDD